MVVLLTLVTKVMDFAVADVWLERECFERELRRWKERREMEFDLLGTKLSFED